MPGTFRFRFGWGALEFEASSAGSDGPGTGTLFDSSVNYTPGAPIGLRKLVLRWTRTFGGVSEDYAVVDLAWLNVTSGAPDDTWNNADFAAVETAAAAWWTSVKPFVHGGYTLAGGDWYKIVSPGVASPKLRTWALNSVGTSTGDPLPPQVAVSVTLKTQLRKRWGRIYLPGFAEGQNDGNGRLLSTTRASLATSTGTFLSASMAGQGIYPVVFSKTMQAAYSVETVQVDDIYDTMRSRRYRNSINRSTATIA